MRNDPELKKKMEENSKRMKEKLFKNMNEEDKKLIEGYLQ